MTHPKATVKSRMASCPIERIVKSMACTKVPAGRSGTHARSSCGGWPPRARPRQPWRQRGRRLEVPRYGPRTVGAVGCRRRPGLSGGLRARRWARSSELTPQRSACACSRARRRHRGEVRGVHVHPTTAVAIAATISRSRCNGVARATRDKDTIGCGTSAAAAMDASDNNAPRHAQSSAISATSIVSVSA